jgi:hypothetical protein
MAMTASERRDAWIEDLQGPLNAHLDATGELPPQDDPLWGAFRARVVAEGPALGRTERWQAAVAWYAPSRHPDAAPSWVVTQGLVWLCHANA